LAEVVVNAEKQNSRLTEHSLVNTDALHRVIHARGQSLPDLIAMRSGQKLVFPDGVAYPVNTEQVRELFNYAASTGCRVIPYGGGTSVVGHVNPLPGDSPVLTVDLSRLNGLLKFDSESQLATFGAGISGPDLEAILRARGFTLGHFPQSFELSSLGGWIASRSSGQQSLFYGRIERLFAGGVMESPSGTLEVPVFPASAAATDMREVVLGSEGRMGIITEATVRITPLPEEEVFTGLFFPDFEQGKQAVQTIAQARLPLSMLRLSNPVETATNLALAGNRTVITWLEKYLGWRGAGESRCLLLLGATGKRPVVQYALDAALEIAQQNGAVVLGPLGKELGRAWQKSRFRTPYLRNSLWEIGYAVDTVETAATWDKVSRIMQEVETGLHQALSEIGERVHVFTHLSHVYPHGSSVYTTYLFRLGWNAAESLRRWQLLKGAASRAIINCGGTISHQHGVGLDHMPYLAKEKGQPGLEAMKNLYKTFDPTGIMNPGKTVTD
jgi:alkyldihydroxyacetonephosphate synthase